MTTEHTPTTPTTTTATPVGETYTLRDPESGHSYDQSYRTLDEARDAARAWTAEYERAGGPTDRTYWVDTLILTTDEDGDEVVVERVTVAVNPPVPPCNRPEGHDWQSPVEIVGGVESNPGVRGHGGGVIITEVCMVCGCACIVDTWAHRPDTGEQGLESTRYDRETYVDAVEAYRREREA